MVDLLSLDEPKSVEEICEEYNLKKATVYRWLKEFKTETGAFKDESILAYEKEIKALKKQLKDAQEERDNLKKGSKHLLRERQIRYEFIKRNSKTYVVEKMCKCMEVSVNSYYNWLRTKDKLKPKSKTSFYKKRIQQVWEASRKTYGSIRIQKQQEREGVILHRSYVAYLMKQLKIKSIHPKKFRVNTTDSNHHFPITKNILNRNFDSTELGEKWVSDITYIQIAGKWNYVTTILDLADRKIVAWTLSDDMTTENTVYKTWLKAIQIRQITLNHVFHSDRGVQYASNKMKNLFTSNLKITQSMSRKGNCWDNAVAESFFKTLKYECTNRYVFKSRLFAHKIIENYINWYNYERLHSSIGYLTPAEMELKIRMKKYKKVA
ncbi:IS3 family transposase [Flavivirga aquatica]|nr:IS3 family transposase [Flavivirga aquatica]